MGPGPSQAASALSSGFDPANINPSAERLVIRGDGADQSQLAMYVSLATWCPSCREHQPEIQTLREQFGPDALAMYGVPIDDTDTAEKLDEYARDTQPAYAIMGQLESGAVRQNGCDPPGY